MRLINADNIRGLAKYIKTNEKFEPYIMIDDLTKGLDEQPTAYDVDEVVEELELESFKFGKDGFSEKYVRLSDAIEIVKRGCVSDDVCEWNGEQSRLVRYTTFTTACGYNFDLETNNELLKAFRHCPFCGKKLKVVE